MLNAIDGVFFVCPDGALVRFSFFFLVFASQNELRQVFDTHHDVASRENYYGTGGRQRSTGQCIVNVFGLVLQFSPPTLTKRGHHMLKVSLVDESLLDQIDSDDVQLSRMPITLVIFCKKNKDLPTLRMAGDVLRLHRVVVQVKLYLSCVLWQDFQHVHQVQ